MKLIVIFKKMKKKNLVAEKARLDRSSVTQNYAIEPRSNRDFLATGFFFHFLKNYY